MDITALYQRVLLNAPEVATIAKDLAQKYTGQITQQSQQLQGAGLSTLLKGVV